MSSSIFDQVKHSLEGMVMTKEEIDAYKAEHGVDSVKKDLRPGGKAFKRLPAIMSKRTFSGYLETGTKFFERAHELTGKRLLRDLFTDEIVIQTLDEYYQDMAPSTLNTVLSALGMIWDGCYKEGWVKGTNVVTDELRAHVKAYRDDSDVRKPRFGYRPEDAERLLAHLQESGSEFALPAEIALRCGLRLSEIAGMQGEHINSDGTLTVKGKGGKVRKVPLPADLKAKLNPSMQYLFTPNQAWKSDFYRAVRKAAQELDIQVSGIHRLRANFAQNEQKKLMEQGMDETEARLAVSRMLGHNRTDVTKGYVPTC